MILQRTRVREPVVIMGETGCGKTYLVKYIVEVLFKHYSVYKEFIFHHGVEESDFVEFMYDLIDDANHELERVRQMNKKKKENMNSEESDEKPKIFWVFFDEFNTSHLQAFVSEIMHDRVFSLGNDSSSKFYSLFNQRIPNS
jgi:MoxR-like ATPase